MSVESLISHEKYDYDDLRAAVLGGGHATIGTS